MERPLTFSFWLCLLCFGSVFGQPALGDGASSGRHYVQTTRYLVPFSSTPSNPTVQQAMRDIAYYDGLGRLWQTVSVRASGGTGYQDVVTPVVYDAYGRQVYDYLPYATSTGAGGAFKSDAVTAQLSYYGGILERIHTEEGYISLSGSTPTYHYYLSDHLGNVRSVLTPSGSTFAVVQQQDYYPYGLRKALAGAGENPYLYNGKELQGELGGQYDYSPFSCF